MVSAVDNTLTTQASAVSEVTANSSPRELLQDPRVRALLDTVAYAEGTGDRYNITFGHHEFSDMSRHPNRVVTEGGYSSTAAGRYQFLSRTWDGVADRLGLTDFSPQSQDLAAVQLMKDRGMIEPLLNGDFEGAIRAGAPEWASLPTANGTSYYGQPVRDISNLRNVYDDAVAEHGDGTAPVRTAPDDGGTTTGTGSGGSTGGTTDAPPRQVDGVTHTIGARETLWGIAKDHKMSVAELLALPGNERFNANPDLIYRGDTINVGRAAHDHVVKPRQTLSGIAADKDISLQELIAANPQFGPGGDRNPNLIHPGETLRIPGAARPEGGATGGSTGGTPAGNDDVATTPGGGTVATPPVANGTDWAPFTVRSGGREITDPSQAKSHHSDADGRVYRGQTLIPHDVVIQAPGKGRNDTPIPSPVSGTVVETGSGIAQDANGHGGRGNYVVLQSDTGDYVKIYHMTDVSVARGDRIEYGQALGTQGNTGASQGTHVHIESSDGIFRTWLGDLMDGSFDGRKAA